MLLSITAGIGIFGPLRSSKISKKFCAAIHNVSKIWGLLVFASGASVPWLCLFTLSNLFIYLPD
jgi:hypothetical protein